MVNPTRMAKERCWKGRWRRYQSIQFVAELFTLSPEVGCSKARHEHIFNPGKLKQWRKSCSLHLGAHSHSGDAGNLYRSSSFQLPSVTSISTFPPPSSPHHLLSAATFVYRLLRNRIMTVYLLWERVKTYPSEPGKILSSKQKWIFLTYLCLTRAKLSTWPRKDKNI